MFATLRRMVLIASLAAPAWWMGQAGLSVAPAAQSATPVAIPFDLATRHIIVPVSVNGSRTLSFVLDTGADGAIIQRARAEELGLTLYGQVSAGGAGAGRVSGSLVRDAKWTLQGLAGFSQPIALALDLANLSPALGRDIDGIIGGTFIQEFVLELDYQARRIALHDRDTFQYTGRGETLPLEFTGNHPIVRATVTPAGGVPLDGRFVLDIGSGMALSLYSPFVKRNSLPGAAATTIRAIGAAGAGGTTNGRIGRVAELAIGSFRIKEPITLFSEDAAGAFANPAQAGNIGAQIANRFRLFFDYGRRRLILEPSSTFNDPFDRAFSGLALRAYGADYRTFRIVEILEKSPASDAGLRVDDVIAAVDGRPAEAFTLSTLNESFERAATYELTVRRGDRTLKLTLTTRKLI